MKDTNTVINICKLVCIEKDGCHIQHTPTHYNCAVYISIKSLLSFLEQKQNSNGQNKITNPKYLICPKCGNMTLDYGRGFNYQCLRRVCCWQGNEALTLEAWQSKHHIPNRTVKVHSDIDLLEGVQSYPKQMAKLMQGKTNHLATIAQVQVHDGEDVIVQKRNK
ncbi:MAG: hypothetical protein WC516_08460 [Patescibacteria group bacterium]|jgi:hypothetical protein